MSLQFARELNRIESALKNVRAHLEQLDEDAEKVALEKEALVKENWALRRDKATHGSEEDLVSELEHVVDTLQSKNQQTKATVQEIRAQLGQIRQAITQ